MVGVYFPANGKFYGMGGRSADTAGSDFTHPFEYDPASNSWTTKAATYADNQVNNMKKKSTLQSAFFNLRVLIGLFVFLAGVFLALLSFGFFSSAKAQSRKVDNANADAVAVAQAFTPVVSKSFNGDVRTLRPVPSKEDERDWEERLILPDLPIGPESRATQLPPAVTIPAAPMEPRMRTS